MSGTSKNIVNGTYTAPDVSRDLLPWAIDRLAKEEPEAVFLNVTGVGGNKKITFRQYANAINGTAWWLEHHLGRGHIDEGLAYLGSSGGDMYFPILLVAAVKAGYFVSPMALLFHSWAPS